MAPSRPQRRRFRRILSVEQLETRCQPSTLLPGFDVPDTLPQALELTPVAGQVRVHSTIGDNQHGGADVDWFRLDLEHTSEIAVTLAGLSTVSLYNHDPFSQALTVSPLGRRLLERVSSDGGPDVFSRTLAPGTYYLAVSGAGNTAFHPLAADSGVVGRTGSYTLDVSLRALPDAGITLLATDLPADGLLPQSPRGVHLSLSGDPGLWDAMVFQLIDGGPGDFVPLETAWFSPQSNELQLVFAQALAPGSYQILAFGGDNFDFLFEPITFTVTGIEGGDQDNDSIATAQHLGVLQLNQLLQRSGAIGDNPAYIFTGDPFLPGPAADLDFYRFSITGPGRYAFTAEVFAGRQGSALDAGLTLFRLVDGQLTLIAGNHNSANTRADAAFYFDPVLFRNLEAGEYVLLVSADINALDPLRGESLADAAYDPTVSNSALGGETVGAYVLNLLLQPGDEQAPQVSHVSITAGARFEQPLATFTVAFSETMNLGQLTKQGLAASIFIAGSGGLAPAPRLLRYDTESNVATFVMVDRLPAGDYTLHVSSAAGLADRFGNALAKEVAVGFTILSGGPANPLLRVVNAAQDSFSNPTHLGMLFGRELEQGIHVVRANAPGTTHDQADYYRFSAVHSGQYLFELGGLGVNTSGRPVLLDAAGNPVTLQQDPLNPLSRTLNIMLPAGEYTIRVSWDSGITPVYDLLIASTLANENPTPLTQGPAPAVRLQLLTAAPPVPQAPQISVQVRDATVISAQFGHTGGTPRLPSGGATSLAAGPLGGPAGSDGAEGTLANLRLSPSTFTFASAKHGLLLVEPEGFIPEGETPPAAETGPAWRQLLDLLFKSIVPLSVTDFFRYMPALFVPSMVPADDAAAVPATEPTSTWQTTANDETWSAACAAVAVLAAAPQRERRRQRTGRRGWIF